MEEDIDYTVLDEMFNITEWLKEQDVDDGSTEDRKVNKIQILSGEFKNKTFCFISVKFDESGAPNFGCINFDTITEEQAERFKYTSYNILKDVMNRNGAH